jgi:hypothetical protein
MIQQIVLDDVVKKYTTLIPPQRSKECTQKKHILGRQCQYILCKRKIYNNDIIGVDIVSLTYHQCHNEPENKIWSLIMKTQHLIQEINIINNEIERQTRTMAKNIND